MHLRSALTGLTLAVILAGGGIEAANAAEAPPVDAGRASLAMPSEQMGGMKTFINHTGLPLQVTIFIRQGADPANGDAGQETFTLASGSREAESYGNSSNIYLNGLAYLASDSQQQTAESRRVVARGGAWDNLLNTNNTITFTTLNIDSVSGSNT